MFAGNQITQGAIFATVECEVFHVFVLVSCNLLAGLGKLFLAHDVRKCLSVVVPLSCTSLSFSYSGFCSCNLVFLSWFLTDFFVLVLIFLENVANPPFRHAITLFGLKLS